MNQVLGTATAARRRGCQADPVMLPAGADRRGRDPAGRPHRATDRAIAALAVPAFGALVAQPLFLLVDAAVVGTLGTAALAGLGAAGTIFGLVVGLCIFLAYTTTSSVARRLGAGDWEGGLAQGLDGMVLGALLGVLLGLATWPFAAPLVGLLGVSDEAAPYAVAYLHVIAWVLPAVLVGTAGVGVLRGLQDTRTTLVITVVVVGLNTVLSPLLVLGLHWGIEGSAIATAVAEVVQALAYLAVLVRIARRRGVRLRPTGFGLLAAIGDGAPLFWRTLALRGVFLVAAGVAARMGDADLAAYHVSFQVWILLALAADALAIAGQALLGLRLGAGDLLGARAVTGRLVRLGLWLGIALGLLLLAVRPWLPSWFSADPQVQALLAGALLVAALQQPLAAPVFAVDGVLIGAGDGRWLAGAGTVMLLAFLPAAWLVLTLDLGVVGLWWALTWFMLVRGLLLAHRVRGDGWLRAGATTRNVTGR
ncbi:MAG TPA: MATE family efflux transporter [Candidatus Nanopelagicales bacterium]|nr:MATE family efflux transporter [Candidatus Nanopelagicales bacterium]